MSYRGHAKASRSRTRHRQHHVCPFLQKAGGISSDQRSAWPGRNRPREIGLLLAPGRRGWGRDCPLASWGRPPPVSRWHDRHRNVVDNHVRLFCMKENHNLLMRIISYLIWLIDSNFLLHARKLYHNRRDGHAREHFLLHGRKLPWLPLNAGLMQGKSTTVVIVARRWDRSHGVADGRTKAIIVPKRCLHFVLFSCRRLYDLCRKPASYGRISHLILPKY